MNKILITISLSIFCIFNSTHSQSLDNELLNDYYYSEDNEEKDFYLKKLYFPELLNSDIQIENVSDSTLNTLGISSSEVDSTTAYNQAFTRALGIASLRNANIRGLTDYFENSSESNGSSNLGYFYRISSKDTFNLASIKVVNNELLSNGENILKIEISKNKNKPDSNKIKVSSECTIYKSSYNVGRYTYTDFLISLKTNYLNLLTKERHCDSLQITIVDNNIPTFSQKFDTIDIKLGQYYKYLNSQNDIDKVNYAKFSAYNGLWQAIVCSLFSNIVNEISYSNAYIYNINDVYNKNREENLNREVLKNFKASVSLEKVYCFRNEICTLINIK